MMKRFSALLCLALACLFAIPSWAALGIGASGQFTFVGTSGTTSAVTTQATGSTFVVFYNSSVPADITAPTDSKGNTYTLTSINFLYNSSTNGGQVWVCQNCIGGAGHTFTGTASAFSVVVGFAVEITSSGAFGVLDQSAQTPNLAGVTTANSPSITPTVNGEVVLSFLAGSVPTNTTLTDATGYNNIIQANANGATNNNYIGGVGGLVQTTAAATSDIFTIGATSAVGTATLSFMPNSGSAATSGPSALWPPKRF